MANPEVCAKIEYEAAKHDVPLKDLIVEYCVRNGVDPEDFADDVITPRLKKKLKEELIASGGLKRKR